MRPRKYPYLGTAKTKKPTKEGKPELVVFPNIAIRKEWLKHIFSVIKNHDNSTIIYFRLPRNFGLSHEEQNIKVNLKYEETLELLNKNS
ncbi:hypothetical protein [Streptococcus timonensis]|uniref:hypothetical protein n=1 Tax=Streptococcus timonensis TaxID=1852387 RepID=UPI00094EF849|nr:hypothetical protein [Streptococcus timonensis]